MDELDKIIRESIKKVIAEQDLVPDNGIVRNKFINQWKMLRNLWPNVMQSMDYTFKDNKGRITKQHIDNIVEYVNMSINNILSK